MIVLLTGSLAQAQHHGGECADRPAPVLNVADITGDGAVDQDDQDRMQDKLERAREEGFYYALYDLNADGVLDAEDLRLLRRDIIEYGDDVPLIETQVAQTAIVAEKYLDFDQVIADGYWPATREFQGHGSHWTLEGNGMSWSDYRAQSFDHQAPPGLNLDEDGNLLAVYFFVDFSVTPLDVPPEGYATHEDQWHHHAQACGWSMGATDDNGDFDPDLVSFIDFIPQRTGVPWWYVDETNNTCTYQPLIDALLAAGRIAIPPQNTVVWDGFHMLHLWLNKPNPCGRFAGQHPDVEGDPIPPIPGAEPGQGH